MKYRFSKVLDCPSTFLLIGTERNVGIYCISGIFHRTSDRHLDLPRKMNTYWSMYQTKGQISSNKLLKFNGLTKFSNLKI